MLYLLYDDVFVDDVYDVDVKCVLLTPDDFEVFDVVLFLYQEVDVLADARSHSLLSVSELLMYSL